MRGCTGGGAVRKTAHGFFSFSFFVGALIFALATLLPLRPCLADFRVMSFSSPANAITIKGPSGTPWYKNYGSQPPQPPAPPVTVNTYGGSATSGNQPGSRISGGGSGGSGKGGLVTFGSGGGGPIGTTGPGSVDCAGAIEATITWQGSEPRDKSVIIKETCKVSWGGASGKCNDGLGGTETPNSTGGSSKTIRYTIKNDPAASFTVTNSPTASASGDAPNNAIGANASVSYTVELIPVKINLTGTTALGSSLCVLTGQQLTAKLSAGGFPTVTNMPPFTSANPTWSFASGADKCFGDWIFQDGLDESKSPPVTIPKQDGFVLPVLLNNEDMQFYTKKSGVVKVACSATVKFPDNTTGAINAESGDVNSVRPTSTLTVTNGSVSFGADSFAVSPPQSWHAVITVGSPFTNTGGVGNYCQIITMSRQLDTPTKVGQWKNPLFGLPGLDNTFPYSDNDLDLTQTDTNDGPFQNASFKYIDDMGDDIVLSKAQDSFVMYLMFKPNPNPDVANQNTQWVILKKNTWSWGAQVSRTSVQQTSWTNSILTPPNYQSPVDETEHPTWTRVILNGPMVRQ